MEPDKVSLATWLLGPYREATSFGVRRVGQARHPSPSVVHHTTATSIEVLVNATKTVVIAALAARRSFRRPSSPPLSSPRPCSASPRALDALAHLLELGAVELRDP